MLLHLHNLVKIDQLELRVHIVQSMSTCVSPSIAMQDDSERPDGALSPRDTDSDGGKLSFRTDWCWEGDGPSDARPDVESLFDNYLGVDGLKKRGPRHGTSADLAARITDPVNPDDPDSISILQSCVSMGELSGRGANNHTVDGICQYAHHMLLHGSGNHPRSFDMVAEILGREDAEIFEFGWCVGCGYRHPREDTHGPQCRHDLTCPRCGTAAFEVRCVCPAKLNRLMLQRST